jgi:succinate dehydrogenase / fumarate reductase flavoprotein subunit
MHIRNELLDVVIVGGVARGIVTRDLVTGQIDCHAADVVVLATGGYSNVFYLSTNAKASNCTAIWRAHRRGALFGNPCFTQIHPTCIPLSNEHQSKLTLMSESLRNDGRVWVPKKRVKPLQPILRKVAGLLSRDSLSKFWESRAARRRVAKREGSVR